MAESKSAWRIATELGSLIGGLDPSSDAYRPRLRYLLVDVVPWGGTLSEGRVEFRRLDAEG